MIRNIPIVGYGNGVFADRGKGSVFSMEFEKLQMIISEVLSVEPENVRSDMSFVEDLGADSLEIFQIIMAIEEEFDIAMDDEAAQSIQTVEDALKAIGENNN